MTIPFLVSSSYSFIFFLFILDFWLLVTRISPDEAEGGRVDFIDEEGKGSTQHDAHEIRCLNKNIRSI
jgi:hypothetical protein